MSSGKQLGAIQYLVLPHVNLNVIGSGGVRRDSFKWGRFDLWKDTAQNWLRFLGTQRSTRRMGCYVDQEGNPLTNIWLANSRVGRIDADGFRELVAALFYLSFARCRFSPPNSEEFYSEPFDVPDDGPQNSEAHVRVTKYAWNYETSLKIYPSPDTYSKSHALLLPDASTIGAQDQNAVDLFEALGTELEEPQSRNLRALVFFFESRFRSPSRSSFAADIQKICSGFEAFFDIPRSGSTAENVAAKLVELFGETAPRFGTAGEPESPLVLDRLKEWVNRLYAVRNAYAHGGTVESLSFKGRSIWRDAFEVFRLTANRVILDRPEVTREGCTELCLVLLSDDNLAGFIRTFSKSSRWLKGGQIETGHEVIIIEAVRKAKCIEPRHLTEDLISTKPFAQALYRLASLVYYLVTNAPAVNKTDYVRSRREYLEKLDQAYQEASSQGRLDVDLYLGRAQSVLGDDLPGIRLGDVRMVELTNLFSELYSNVFRRPGGRDRFRRS